MHPQGTEWTVSAQAPYPTLRYCEEGTEGMDRMECLVPVGHNDSGERLEQQDKGENLQQRALRVPLDHKDKKEGSGVPLGLKDRGEILEQQALRVPLALGVVGWSTQDGAQKLAVQVSQELSCCMQGTQASHFRLMTTTFPVLCAVLQ